MSGSYDALYQAWTSDMEAFWADRVRLLDWNRVPQQVLAADDPPFYRWFPDGELNTCHNCLDRHVAADRGDQPALIYDSPVTETQQTFTYSELLDSTAHAAGAFRALGVERGDRVLIYMPMIPEAVIAMLACARIGAVHSVVFGGFAAPELASRIDDATPKLVVAGSCGIEPNRVVAYKPMLDQALELADHTPASCLIKQRDAARAELIEGRDLDWDLALATAAAADCVAVSALDPLYILYTSGTTGDPKGIVRDHGGHAVALANSMAMTYGLKPGEVFWAASDVGWVVGHSYIVYAPLLHGCATILYEGKPVGTPDAGAFWRVIAQHNVAVLFTAPTAFRAIRRADPDAKLLQDYDLDGFRTLFLAGERADPDTVRWAEQVLDVPVLDHWWQTETGWSITGYFAGTEGFPVRPGSAGKPAPGYALEVLDDDGHTVPAGDIGALAVRLPMPPGFSPTLWRNRERFRTAYLDMFPGYYSTADAGMVDADGYVWVMARTDDIINCAGHRLSTGAMEEVLTQHADVAECAVVGVQDRLKGQVPIGLLVLNAGVTRDPEAIAGETVQMVREAIGAVASFRTAAVVQQLPKTRSGKILRNVIAAIADGRTPKVPPTIEDPSVLDGIQSTLGAVGLPRE
ncbi:MAG: AMP-binding protein [Alphaproteobacteria bacterium]|nr:AMP-binding protein [Alphaproteobacteria bacterium]